MWRQRLQNSYPETNKKANKPKQRMLVLACCDYLAGGPVKQPHSSSTPVWSQERRNVGKCAPGACCDSETTITNLKGCLKMSSRILFWWFDKSHSAWVVSGSVAWLPLGWRVETGGKGSGTRVPGSAAWRNSLHKEPRREARSRRETAPNQP